MHCQACYYAVLLIFQFTECFAIAQTSIDCNCIISHGKQLRTKYAECTLIQLSSVASNQSKRLAFTSSTHGAVSRRPEGEGAAVTRGHSRCPDRGCRVGCGHAVQQQGVHGAAAGRCSGSDPAARPVAQEHFALALHRAPLPMEKLATYRCEKGLMDEWAGEKD